MDCTRSQELLSPHLDNELPSAEAAELSAHLLSCPGCGKSFDELKRASRLVRGMSLAPLPAGFMARLEERRRSGAAPAAAAASSWWSPQALAWAGAAAVVAVVIVGPWRQARLARAPGYALPDAADAAPPSLKVAAEPPPPAVPPAAPQGVLAASAGAMQNAPAAPAAAASSPLPIPMAQDQAPRDSVVPETAALLARTAAANARASRGGGVPFGEREQYSNEQLQQMMGGQNSGDDSVAGVATEDDEPKPEPFMGRRLGQKDTHAKAERSIRQLVAMRQAVEASAGKASIVPIDGSVAPVLGNAGAGGGVVSNAALTDGFWSGDFAAGNEGTHTIEDPRIWAALWRSLSTSPAPAVDFARSRVVAVFLGPRPTGGYAVEFMDIAHTPRRVVVKWRERAPEPGQSPPDGATSPYALKVIPRGDQPVRFEKVK